MNKENSPTNRKAEIADKPELADYKDGKILNAL